MSIYDSKIQDDWAKDYNRKLEGEYYTVNSEKEPHENPDTIDYQMYHRIDYEFIGVQPPRKMIYKYHPIKHKEIYENIYNKIVELNSKYPKLFQFKENKDDTKIKYGFSIYGLSTTLYYLWFKNLEQKINVYEFDISKQIFGENMNVPYVPNETYQFALIANMYIDDKGELYISFTFKNNGISLFNTLNIKTEIYNARDISRDYWLKQVYTCVLCLETYLSNINYKE